MEYRVYLGHEGLPISAAILHSIICPTLVGRAPQLAALRALQERAAVGQGQVVLLAGPAGIGKSRLVRELAETGPAGHIVGPPLMITCGCFEPDRAVPYAPFRDLLQRITERRRLGRRHPARTSVVRLMRWRTGSRIWPVPGPSSWSSKICIGAMTSASTHCCT